MSEETFEEWIDTLRAKHGTLRRVAEQIGMTESGFFRGAKRGTLSAENLLLLAALTDESPSRVLIMAGKGSLAELLERLYGAPSRDALTSSQRALIETWEQIPGHVQKHFDVLLRYARDVAAHAPPEKTSPIPESPGRRRRATQRRSAGRTSAEKP